MTHTDHIQEHEAQRAYQAASERRYDAMSRKDQAQHDTYQARCEDDWCRLRDIEFQGGAACPPFSEYMHSRNAW